MKQKTAYGLFDRIERHPGVFVALLTFILFLPILTVPYFPSEDGPVHLDIVRLMHDLGTTRFPIGGEYLQTNPYIEPNSTIYLFFLALYHFLLPQTIEKLFLFIYASLFAAAALYCIDSINKTNRVVALLFLPLIFNTYLQLGFFNDALSLTIFLFAVGYYHRSHANWTIHRSIVMGLLGLLCTLTHITALVMLLMTIGLLEIFEAIEGIIAGEPHAITGALLKLSKRAFLMVAIFAPSIVILASFSFRNGISAVSTYQPLRSGLIGLFLSLRHRLIPLASLIFGNPWLYGPYFLLLAILVGFSIRHLRAREVFAPSNRWLVILLIVIVLYFTITLNTHEVEFYERMPPYLFFFAIMSVSALSIARYLRHIIVVVVSLTAIFSAVDREARYAHATPEMNEIMSVADHIRPNATILVLHFKQTNISDPYMTGVNPYLHITARIATLRSGIAMDSSLLSTSVTGYFPVQYRPDRDPYIYLRVDPTRPEIEAVPPRIDLEDYTARTGGSIDYVLIQDFQATEWMHEPTAQDLLRQVSEGYREIYRSKPTGAVIVYERKDHQDHGSQ